MKHTIFLPLSLLLSIPLFGQTYLAPVVGWEVLTYVQARNQGGGQTRTLSGSDRYTDNPVFGLQLIQHLTPSISLQYAAYGSRKGLVHRQLGFANEIRVRHHFYTHQHDLQVNLATEENVHFGLGGNYLYMGKFIRADDDAVVAEGKQEWGIHLSMSYRYKQWIAEFRYRQSLNLRQRETDAILFDDPTRSFTLTVGYLLQLSHK